ncbi:Gfo/Idh/MocA family oxidoreductase [Telluria mixta]|uniref:Gfo/Idh/MocA family oxidoreductase n=1 Tax=Telluria mixta TaxID=34071 RepID=A0ABT2C0N8_9BURK|nr:Gfo/Idh/MocA family oxidoreductase [Telluria mixta]MCS0630229.1 Gfo/Idh/MocA family oxidoreductase [Telluria mixta]WEM94463.1 Gfo/Idh/MocA family oxidoreductase [Telluria mixta]
MSFEPVRVGVIGVGDISGVYLNAISRSPALALRAVAARSMQRAATAGRRHGVPGVTVDALLADDGIEVVVNLTPSDQHETLNRRIVAAGKHLYSEKPFALSSRVATELVQDAGRRNVRIGSAPDTFFGGAHQAARALVDQGAIGTPVFGHAFVGLPGLEHFHPNPAQFYRPGGEPPYDIGPYFITQWINLLGPVRQVFASAGAGAAQRTIRRGPLHGTSFPVDVPTTFNAVLEFDAASVALTLSLDVAAPTLRPGELYGSGGTLALADPIFFSGEPALFQPDQGRTVCAIADRPFSTPNRLNHMGRPVADYRGVGLVDLAIALRHGSAHRTAPDLIVHAVEVMEALVTSGREKRAVPLHTSCARPAPLDRERDALLIDMTPSPFDPDALADKGGHALQEH